MPRPEGLRRRKPYRIPEAVSALPGSPNESAGIRLPASVRHRKPYLDHTAPRAPAKESREGAEQSLPNRGCRAYCGSKVAAQRMPCWECRTACDSNSCCGEDAEPRMPGILRLKSRRTEDAVLGMSDSMRLEQLLCRRCRADRTKRRDNIENLKTQLNNHYEE